VFTNEDQRAKVLNVDLVSRMWSKTFMLIVPIPGYEESARNLSRLSASQPDVERVEDESRLRALLEQLPCCTSNEKGEPGEPLNLVLIGELDELGPAFQRQNYRVAEVSPRYVFDRPQDLAGSKLARWVPAQPHQIRIWLTTICYQGKPVWVAQASTPLGGRFRTETREKPLAIEPEVDDARNDIVQDMVYSQSVMRIGYVDGAGRVVSSEPRTTPGGAIYQTDGLRAVLVFGQESVSLSEIEFFEWQRLIDHHREQMSAADGE
jgi:hypothetical protein